MSMRPQVEPPPFWIYALMMAGAWQVGAWIGYVAALIMRRF